LAILFSRDRKSNRFTPSVIPEGTFLLQAKEHEITNPSQRIALFSVVDVEELLLLSDLPVVFVPPKRRPKPCVGGLTTTPLLQENPSAAKGQPKSGDLSPPSMIERPVFVCHRAFG